MEIREVMMGTAMNAIVNGRSVGTAKKRDRGWHVRCRVGKPFTVPAGAVIKEGTPCSNAEFKTKAEARKALQECAALAQ